MVELKFCGLTRAQDAAVAEAVGARYVGVVFAGGPRQQDAAGARRVWSGLSGRGVRRVGVFGAGAPEALVALARQAEVDVMQLHGDPGPAVVAAVQGAFTGEVWPVWRLGDVASLDGMASRCGGAVSVVLDTLVPGQLGGTGVALDWARLGPALAALAHAPRIVLAGGLRPESVAEAVRLVRPAVVDVSSGVESAPGIKDHERMRAFAAAARGAGVAA